MAVSHGSTHPGIAVVRSILPVVVGALPAFLTGALAVQLTADLGFGVSGLGIPVASFFLASALTSIVFGRAVERLGGAVGLRLGAAGSAASMLLVAVGARSLETLAAALALGGLANALTQPAANLYLARIIPPRRRGLAFAVKQSAIPGATLLAGLAVPTLAVTVGWRWAYVAGTALAVLASGGAGGPDGSRRTEGASRRPDSSPVALVVFTVGIGCGAAAASGLATFFVASAVNAGIAEGYAGLVFAAGSAIGITTRITLGHRADRVGGDQLRVVMVQLCIGAAALALLGVPVPWVAIVVTPVAFAAGWGWPGLFNFAIVSANPRAPARATGTTQTGTYLGAMLGPLAFGAVVGETSYTVAWAMAAGLALAAASLIATGRRIDPAARSTARAEGAGHRAPSSGAEPL